MGVICGWSWADSRARMKPLLEGRGEMGSLHQWLLGFPSALEFEEWWEASKAHPEGQKLAQELPSS